MFTRLTFFLRESREQSLQTLFTWGLFRRNRLKLIRLDPQARLSGLMDVIQPSCLSSTSYSPIGCFSYTIYLLFFPAIYISHAYSIGAKIPKFRESSYSKGSASLISKVWILFSNVIPKTQQWNFISVAGICDCILLVITRDWPP